MARIVQPLQRKVRSTPEVRLGRVLTRRGTRCAGAHLDCPACLRGPVPSAFRRARFREPRRTRFGPDAPVSAPRMRRRRATRRCH